MRRLNRVWQIAVGPAVIVLVAATQANAQDDAAQPNASGGKQSVTIHEFQGMLGCASCHNQSDRINNLLSRALCQLTESRIFDDEDKHALAHKKLHEPLAQRMG